MPLDTDPAAEARQLEILRRMTPEARMQLAFDMSESMREMALAGLRHRYPALNPQELKRQLLQLAYGDLTRP